MRWNRLWGALALLLAVTAGCKQRAFMTEADFNQVQTTSLENMEYKPDLGAQPITELIGPPPTLNNLDRQIRFVSLAECIAISLESGRVGQPSLLFPGSSLDNLVQFTGRGVSGSDAIRVLALAPAQTGADIDASLSKFDAVFTSSLNWQTTDQPIGTPLQTFQSGGGVTAINTQQFQGSVGLLKPMATGGVAGITFNLPYQLTNLPARVNPSYQPSLQFAFEQPLLQGFGTEINQIRAQHPGSLLNPGVLNTAPTGEGILITRLRFDQSRASLEASVNQMLLNVETAYWNLYGSYWTLYSREQGLRFAFAAFRSIKARYEAGRENIGNFYQSRGQYELFRAQRLQALDQVLENERQLRALIGIPIEDGTRLMPSDSPTLAPFQPDWNGALVEAYQKRPELYMLRQEIKANQLAILAEKNNLLPDLRLTATWDVNAIGNRLDGSSTGTPVINDVTGAITGFRDTNALRGLSENNFHNWSVGVRSVIPIGYRASYARLRQAQLQLARSIETLQDQELKTQSYLANFYRRLSLNYEQIRANRAQREAFGEQLRARNESYNAGRDTLDILLEAQRFWADALANEYQAIVSYNNALAGWEFAKGTIQQHNNVHIAEGALPQMAAVRAVDHERQRTAAIVFRERATPVAITPVATRVETTDGRAPTLPSVMSAVPPLKDAPTLPETMDALRSTTIPGPVDAKPDELFPAPSTNAPTVVPPPVTTLPAPSTGSTKTGPSAPTKPASRRESDFGMSRER
jgi:outer membrane protein TolC